MEVEVFCIKTEGLSNTPNQFNGALAPTSNAVIRVYLFSCTAHPATNCLALSNPD